MRIPEVPKPFLACALLALTIAGCAARPYTPAAGELPAVPGNWTRAEATAAAPAAADTDRLARWWRNFEDAQLGALVESALEHNADVRSARAALRQARAQRTASAAGLRPTLDASAAAARTRSDGQNAANRFQLGVDASWELDLAGGLLAGVAAAEADARASAATLDDTRVSIAAEVALAYIELRSNQQRLAVARANLASQEEALQLTRWREQAGLVTRLEVEQARATVEETRASLSSLASAIVQALDSLAVLCGRTPGSLHAHLGAHDTAAVVPRAPQALALGLPADTLRQRPDVRAAEQRVAAARARVDVAQAARYPSLRLSGSLGLSALTLGALDGARAASELLAGIGLPLFDGGALAAQVEVRDAELEQAYHAYSAAVLQALQEVEDALDALRASHTALASLEQAAGAAANADTLAGQRYASGLVDFQVVLDTQRSRLSAEDGVVGARAQVAANHVRLYKALGGGWSAAAEPGSATISPDRDIAP